MADELQGDALMLEMAKQVTFSQRLALRRQRSQNEREAARRAFQDAVSFQKAFDKGWTEYDSIMAEDTRDGL